MGVTLLGGGGLRPFLSGKNISNDCAVFVADSGGVATMLILHPHSALSLLACSVRLCLCLLTCWPRVFLSSIYWPVGRDSTLLVSSSSVPSLFLFLDLAAAPLSFVVVLFLEPSCLVRPSTGNKSMKKK